MKNKSKSFIESVLILLGLIGVIGLLFFGFEGLSSKYGFKSNVKKNSTSTLSIDNSSSSNPSSEENDKNIDFEFKQESFTKLDSFNLSSAGKQYYAYYHLESDYIILGVFMQEFIDDFIYISHAENPIIIVTFFDKVNVEQININEDFVNFAKSSSLDFLNESCGYYLFRHNLFRRISEILDINIFDESYSTYGFTFYSQISNNTLVENLSVKYSGKLLNTYSQAIKINDTIINSGESIKENNTTSNENIACTENECSYENIYNSISSNSSSGGIKVGDSTPNDSGWGQIYG